MLQVHEEVQAMKEQMTAWYEALHKRPEPSFEEYETTEFIREKLETMGGYRIWQVMKTGLIAEIEGGKPGPVIALRADIDCLRMQELTDAPFKSEKEGLMHGCGHASQPHLTIDPVAVGIQIGANLQMLVSREVDPLD